MSTPVFTGFQSSTYIPVKGALGTWKGAVIIVPVKGGSK